MTSAVYDYATVEKTMRHLEAANVFENVDSSHAIHGPRCGPSTETATSALSCPMGPCHEGGLRYCELGLPTLNPSRPIAE
jgi:hypothetical protein